MADAKLARRVLVSSPIDSIYFGGGGGGGTAIGGDGSGEQDLLRDEDGKSDGGGEDNDVKSDGGDDNDEPGKSRGRKHRANVSKSETQKEYRPKVLKSKNVGTRESLATPKPRKPRFLLRWSPTGKMFDSAGKLVAPSGYSKHMTGNLKLLINFIWKFLGTIRFWNDHVAAILGFGDLQWGNLLITRVYFVEGLGHNLFSVGQFYDSDLEVAF
nr:integrase, catalytic region, zinc finger, CCHC-type, peptidase aspartic, catalytic [Tanacetum cinerariifolium]